MPPKKKKPTLSKYGKRMGRPPGSKSRKLAVTPKKFRSPLPRGRPRKDGMPPIQRKKTSICPITGKPESEDLEPEEIRKVRKITKLLARVRHLAGRGMTPPHISVMTGIPVADLSPGGTYYDDVEIGRAEAVLAVAENHYLRVLAGKSTHEVMFFLKSIGGWAETAEGRKKSRGETGEDNEVTGVEVSFSDDDEEGGG